MHSVKILKNAFVKPVEINGVAHADERVDRNTLKVSTLGEPS